MKTDCNVGAVTGSYPERHVERLSPRNRRIIGAKEFLTIEMQTK
jgi:hypothetical protein